MSGAQRRGRRGGRVALAVFGVLGVGAGAVAATGVGLPDGGDDDESEKPVTAQTTAPVTRQTIVDTQTEQGSLTYGDTVTVKGVLNGTVTSLPGPGSIVARGSALYRVDDKPVVLLYGALPAYRTLKVDVEGDDVKQFEQNLAALGYQGFKVDGKFTSATAAAVKQWQEDLDLVENGEVEAGRISYVDGQIRVDSLTTATGDTVQPGKELLTYSGTSRVATVDLDMEDQRLATKDAAVEVTLPNGKSTQGSITSTRTVAEDGSSGGSNGAGGSGESGGSGSSDTTKIKVTVAIADQAALEGLDEASVDIGFTADRRENVLTVPVSALLALAEGGYGVQVVDGVGTRILPVQTGLFARGRVEVSGADLAEGMTVGVPS
ncbi:peptidoglycan-binding protein [Streptomycetaceae bacterium NBC_01309]